MPLTPDASGVFPIAPTPFNPDGSVDWTSADRLFEFYHGIGSDGVTVLGIMGEAPKLTPAESESVIDTVLGEVAGRGVDHLVGQLELVQEGLLDPEQSLVLLVTKPK